MEIFAATFALVFVALAVAGFRALAVLEEHKAAKLAKRQPKPTPYIGPSFSRHSR